MFGVPYVMYPRDLPRRVDSLKSIPPKPAPPSIFTELEDELRDVKRVHAQGQEEDLRYALGRTINRVEELTSMLRDAFKAQTDLKTELTLAKSNLQMALANNEMLEDALKRDGGSGRDVGWRRMSAREQSLKAEEADLRRRSVESLASNGSTSSPTVPPHSPMPPTPLDGHPQHQHLYQQQPRSATMPSPSPVVGENRFFRFRFGGNGSIPSSPRIGSPGMPGAHLTSASLPSLVPDRDKEVEELHHQLDVERKAHKTACDAKVALEEELESLSQALFEEANKMVATERRKLAEREDALRECQEQRDALHRVLKLMESERGRSGETPPAQPVARAHHRASSSSVAIKSRPPSISTSREPSPPEDGARSESPAHEQELDARRPDSPAFAMEPPSSARTIRTPIPDRRMPRRTSSMRRSPTVPPSPEPSSEEPSPQPAAPTSNTLAPPAPPVTVLGPESPEPTPSPSPSPSPEPGQFAFSSGRPVDYLEGEVSPWADATSAVAPSPRVGS